MYNFKALSLLPLSRYLVPSVLSADLVLDIVSLVIIADENHKHDMNEITKRDDFQETTLIKDLYQNCFQQ